MKATAKSLLILVLFTLASCAATPEARWAQGRDALTASQNIVLKAHSTGMLDDNDLIAIDPFVLTARTSLAEAAKYLPSGGLEFDQWMRVLDKSLEQIEQHHIQKQE